MTDDTREQAAREQIAATHKTRDAAVRDASDIYAPTPTQAEIDRSATGEHVIVHEYDGSPIDEDAFDPTPPPGGGGSSAPTISGISPTTAAAMPVDMTVNGSNFTAQSTVMFDGVSQATTFVDATKLTCTISGAASSGNFEVYVSDPAGDSNAVTFNYTGTIRQQQARRRPSADAEQDKPPKESNDGESRQ